MAGYRFSRRAEADLLDIAAYTGLRRMERGRPVIFYRQEVGGILVSRLHQRMLPKDRASTKRMSGCSGVD